jgi:hypothetical protein
MGCARAGHQKEGEAGGARSPVNGAEAPAAWVAADAPSTTDGGENQAGGLSATTEGGVPHPDSAWRRPDLVKGWLDLPPATGQRPLTGENGGRLRFGG